MMADPVLRLRQICLLAHDLEWTSSVLSAAFDAPVVFRDPRMAAGGNLTNTHIRLGDSFLETVCPTDLAWERSTTQTRLLERNGNCGYMAIVQVPDISAASQSMSVQGAGRGIVSGDWNVCAGSPGSGLAGVYSGRYVLGEPLPKKPRHRLRRQRSVPPRRFRHARRGPGELARPWRFSNEQGNVLPRREHVAERG